MRLSDETVRVIVETADRQFGPATQVWLFGSRVRDSARIAYDPAALADLVPTWRVVKKEQALLERTSARLFAEPIDFSWVMSLETVDDRSERVEAFAARYGRLQDTLGNRLFPRLLALVGQQGSTLIDRLNQMERLGLLDDAQAWLVWRNLRNRLVHEYTERPEELVDVLHVAQGYATSLCQVVRRVDAWLRGLGIDEQALAP
jgi:predicted nucleotidyltransferase